MKDCEHCGLPYHDDPSSGDGHGHTIDCPNAILSGSHTPGPWQLWPESGSKPYMIESASAKEVVVPAPAEYWRREDALLVAAAPALLELCREALRWEAEANANNDNLTIDEREDPTSFENRLRVAIHGATGKAP